MGKESPNAGMASSEEIIPAGLLFHPDVETLARSFYEHIERLDPGCEPYVELDNLEEPTRDIYKFCIAHIFKVEPQAAANLATRNDLFGNAKP